LGLVFAGSHITDEEIKLSEDKFAESLHLAQMGMFNLLENDVSWKTTLSLFYYFALLQEVSYS
jgi:endophilin-A